MIDLAPIYKKMRLSELNNRVGGTDPEVVGEACFALAKRFLNFQDNDRILDFGCGIGRVAAKVAVQSEQLVHVTGLDIMPDAVRFCKSAIATCISNTSFELIGGTNDHYNKFINEGERNTNVVSINKFTSSFNKAYAFSVFTHVDFPDFSRVLRLIKLMLKPNSLFLFTCFLLTPQSRLTIRSGSGMFKFANPCFESGSDLFIGDTKDRLAFVAYDIGLMEKMIFEAGFTGSMIEFGAWRGDGFSQSLQDIIVVRSPML